AQWTSGLAAREGGSEPAPRILARATGVGASGMPWRCPFPPARPSPAGRARGAGGAPLGQVGPQRWSGWWLADPHDTLVFSAPVRSGRLPLTVAQAPMLALAALKGRRFSHGDPQWGRRLHTDALVEVLEGNGSSR